MNRSTKSLVWIFVCLLLFALGYVGFGIYQQARTQHIQSESPPPAPLVPNG